MNNTKHAEKRLKQRGFSKMTLEIILNNGVLLNAPGGVKKIFLATKNIRLRSRS